jgi:hypothetical protein
LIRVDRIVGAPPQPIGMPGAEDRSERVDLWAAVIAEGLRATRLTAPRD